MNVGVGSTRILGFVILSLMGPLTSPQEPQPKRIVGLEYPFLANLARVQGRVELIATVTESGNIKDVQVVSGHPLLRESAKSSFSQWVFSRCGETTGPCKARVAFQFVLEGQCESSRCPTEFIVDLPDSVTVRTKAAAPIIN
jgi:hypothetical protein